MKLKAKTPNNFSPIVVSVVVDPLLSIRQICQNLGVSKTTFYSHIGRRYPNQVQISLRRVDWRVSEIKALLDRDVA